jgi:hypothetical protein
MTALQEAEAKMLQLVQRRDAAVSVAAQAIADANREFDHAAVPLARQIRRLKEQAMAQHSGSTTRIRRLLVLEGLTDSEVEHYKRLDAKKET